MAVEEQDRESTLSQASASAGAVFLSYASQDAGAAERIATAFRDAGIQVWFDQSELRGGDAWDRQIRHQIHDCRLFIAVISAHTEAHSANLNGWVQRPYLCSTHAYFSVPTEWQFALLLEHLSARREPLQ